jgi:hypothetical protein
LVKKIAAAMPSFAQEFMDDRTRTQAVVYLLQHEKPGLTLLHLVDLDSEAHDNAPYTREANAVLEYTDELIGHIVAAMPAGYALALVSDHGFERVNTMVNLGPVAAKEGVTNLVQGGGVLIAPDEKSATLVRQLAKDAGYGIGREIPVAELERFPSNQQRGVAAFEPADGFMFFRGPGTETFSKPQEIGNHGHWPMRYRAVYVLWGAAGQRGTIGEISMKEIAGRLAGVLGVRFP